MTLTLELSPKQADKYIKETKDLQLIDVRSPGEFKEGYIKNAKLIPVNTLPARLQDIDKKRPVLIYCASGGRSAMALQFLTEQGYDAKHIVGGIYDWYQEGLPIVEG
jgi:rhodanese-related sulfurtransferase